MRRYILALAAALALATPALAADPVDPVPIVTVEQVLPHYPWDNQVDIYYSLYNLTPGNDYKLVVVWSNMTTGVARDVTSQIFYKPGNSQAWGTLVGSPTTAGNIQGFPYIRNSLHNVVTWVTDLEIFAPSNTLTMHLCDFSADITEKDQGDYLIVDLRTGKIEEAPCASDSRVAYFNTDPHYKTDKLVMRRLLPGDYWLGETMTDTPYNSLHVARLPSKKKVYVGIFPVTRGQWGAVYSREFNWFQKYYDCASYPATYMTWSQQDESNVTQSYNGDRNIRYDFIRGTANSAGGVQGNTCFMWKLNTLVAGNADNKTNYPAITNVLLRAENVGFDLPTESIWEAACRAGAFNSKWGNPASNDVERLKQMAWYTASYTGSRTIRQVGQKEPNSWGFYDMHGLVREWVRDVRSHITNIDIGQQDNTISNVLAMANRSYLGDGWKMFRGSYWNDAEICTRPSYRINYVHWSWAYDWLGFRVCYIAPDEPEEE